MLIPTKFPLSPKEAWAKEPNIYIKQRLFGKFEHFQTAFVAF